MVHALLGHGPRFEVRPPSWPRGVGSLSRTEGLHSSSSALLSLLSVSCTEMKSVALLLACGALGHVLALPNLHERASSSATSTSVSTSLPSASAAPGTPVVEEALPPLQPRCSSRIFCPGKILQTVQLAQLYSDQKTFVDKPARYPTDQIVASFNNLTSSSNFTVAGLEQWVEDNFLGEGLDLVPADIPDFKDEPSFLNTVKDPYVKGFAKAVNSARRPTLPMHA